MVKQEQRLKIDEKIIRDYLAIFNELKFGERPESHIPGNQGK